MPVQNRVRSSAPNDQLPGRPGRQDLRWQGNPCKDLGNDGADAAQKKRPPGAKARQGLKATELAAAQKDAGEPGGDAEEVDVMSKKLM
jgi:hypothetical protein